MSTPLLQVANLCFSHPHTGHPAFCNVTFTLAAGELLCVAGMNGAGKSSLLAVLAGIIPGAQGTLLLSGLDVLHSPDQRETARKQAGMLLQEADMQIFGGSVGEDLLLSLPQKSPEAEAKAMAARFGLLDKWDALPHTLSGGQKRKLCLAATLLRNPSLLLLDEPLSGLDYPASKELCAIIKELLVQGTAIIISTHDLTPFTGLASKWLFLHPEGEALFGPPLTLAPEAERLGIRV